MFPDGSEPRDPRSTPDYNPEKEPPRPKSEWEKYTEEGTPGNNGQKLTIWTPSQFLAHQDDPQDVLLSCGYIEKGSPCAFCGPPGIGKSRLIMQLAITSILGNGFLGWDTNAENMTWLIFQNENGNRRIKGEYAAMLKDLTSPQRALLDKHLLMSAIVSDIDSNLNIADPVVANRMKEAIGDLKPDFVVGDPLTALTVEDLNNDQAMLNTARNFGRLAQTNNARAVPVLVQHARTGKEAQAGMSGSNRGSYARNSKALHGWIRSQFNMGPVEAKKNDRLFFASGKCNNFAEFEEFVIELDIETRFYSKTQESAEDVRKTQEAAEGGKAAGRPPKFSPMDLKDYMSFTVPLGREHVMGIVCKKLKISTKTFGRHWEDARVLHLIEETSDHKWFWKG